MPPHPATLPDADLLAACTQQFTRRGGPGGQHRNRVETAVVLTHRPTGVAAEANERRSREANRQVAVRRLRVRLALAVRTAAGPPSDLWQQRARGERITVCATHADFPSLLAEALDHLASSDFDHAEAARRLGVTATQLLKLLRKAPEAFDQLNQRRRDRGQRPLQ